MQSGPLILTGIRLLTELDALYHGYNDLNSLVRAPLLDTGHDGEIESMVKSGEGIVMLLPVGQIDMCAKAFIKAQEVPVLLLAVHSGKHDKSLRVQAESLGEMLASLANAGVTQTRIEYLHFDPDKGYLKDGLKELLSTFSQAVKWFREIPEAVFCSTPESLISYVAYRMRIKEDADKFSFLRNTLDIDARVRVQKRENGWECSILEFSSRRLDLEDARLTTYAQIDLNAMTSSGCDAMGRLMPLQLHMVLLNSFNKWIRQKKIGSNCELSLTLLCPDEMTRSDIQQSPINVITAAEEARK